MNTVNSTAFNTNDEWVNHILQLEYCICDITHRAELYFSRSVPTGTLNDYYSIRFDSIDMIILDTGNDIDHPTIHIYWTTAKGTRIKCSYPFFTREAYEYAVRFIVNECDNS